MTEESFRKLIKHKIERKQYSTDIISSLVFHSMTPINLCMGPKEEAEVFKEVMKHNEERLLRMVYEDKRREFYEAIDGLHLTNPMDSRSYHDQIDKILKIAKRQ